MNQLTQAIGRFDAFFRSANGVPPNDRISVPTAEWVALRALLTEALSAQAVQAESVAALPWPRAEVDDLLERLVSSHISSFIAGERGSNKPEAREFVKSALVEAAGFIRAVLQPLHPAEGVPWQVLTVEALAEKLRSIGVCGGNAERLMPFLSEYLAATHPTQPAAQGVDVVQAAKALCKHAAKVQNINFDDHWLIHAEEFKEEAQIVLDAAQAAKQGAQP